MEKAKLNIGSKASGDKFAVTIEIDLPTNQGEIETITKGNAEYAVACFNRGHRIRCQEQSGAREYVSGLSVDQRKDIPAVTAKVLEIVTAYVDDEKKETRKAGRPSAPKEFVVDSKTMNISPKQLEAMKAMAAAQGLKLTVI